MKFDPLKNDYSRKQPIYAKNGMVATSQPLAANAGLEVLKIGGNAVDAAVATAAALTVVEPTSNGIGGDAFAIVWMNKKMYGLNASGPSPEGLTIEAVKQDGYDKIPQFGWTPVTVPGAPSAWASLVERFGNLTLEEVLAPAIRYASEGFPVSSTVAHYWRKAFDSFEKEGKNPVFNEWFNTFAPCGHVPTSGDLFFLPHHANTLRKIAQTQAESFYRAARRS